MTDGFSTPKFIAAEIIPLQYQGVCRGKRGCSYCSSTEHFLGTKYLEWVWDLFLHCSKRVKKNIRARPKQNNSCKTLCYVDGHNLWSTLHYTPSRQRQNDKTRNLEGCTAVLYRTCQYIRNWKVRKLVSTLSRTVRTKRFQFWGQCRAHPAVHKNLNLGPKTKRFSTALQLHARFWDKLLGQRIKKKLPSRKVTWCRVV